MNRNKWYGIGHPWLDGRLRRYYRITDEGAAELAAEVGRLRANAAAAASRLGLTGGTI